VLDGRLRGAITYFDRDTKNQIDFLSNNTPPNFGGYANTAKTQADGVEVEGSFEVNSLLTLSANYTNMDAVNKSAGRQLRQGPGAPGRRNRLGGRRAEPRQRPDRRGDDAVCRPQLRQRRQHPALKSYVLTDVRIAYPINDTFELYGRVENLFDQQYETLYRYGTLGRGAFAGVRARF
jgi:vitamin B12 transporter